MLDSSSQASTRGLMTRLYSAGTPAYGYLVHVMIKEAQGLIKAHEGRPETKSVIQVRSSYSRLRFSIHVTLVGYVSRDPASYIKAGRVIDQGKESIATKTPTRPAARRTLVTLIFIP